MFASEQALPDGSTVEKIKQLLGKQKDLLWEDLRKMSVFSICTILSEFKNKYELNINFLYMTVLADFFVVISKSSRKEGPIWENADL